MSNQAEDSFKFFVAFSECPNFNPVAYTTLMFAMNPSLTLHLENSFVRLARAEVSQFPNPTGATTSRNDIESYKK